MDTTKIILLYFLICCTGYTQGQTVEIHNYDCYFNLDYVNDTLCDILVTSSRDKIISNIYGTSLQIVPDVMGELVVDRKLSGQTTFSNAITEKGNICDMINGNGSGGARFIGYMLQVLAPVSNVLSGCPYYPQKYYVNNLTLRANIPIKRADYIAKFTLTTNDDITLFALSGSGTIV